MKTTLILLTALSFFLLTGCGSGGSNKATGRLTVTVQWPEPSRLIPAASNTIVIQVFDGPTEIVADAVAPQTVTVTRPTTSATFTRLPIGNLLLKATAYPGNPATTVAQASGTTIVAVQPG